MSPQEIGATSKHTLIDLLMLAFDVRREAQSVIAILKNLEINKK